ncbi:MAG: hypothetical protein JO092_09045 [Candidatus Eremiobacteraeota bacterium]|nr:hypothetical protein [Candidatus Eremiobacteraeota bacterium]
MKRAWTRRPAGAPSVAIIVISSLVDVPWNIDFSIIGGRPYVARENAERALYLSHRRVVRDATIAFQDVQEDDGSIYDRPLLTPDTADETLVEP